MKLLGAALLILSSTTLGFQYTIKIKKQEMICKELLSLCELLLIDISTKRTPVILLLKTILARDEFSSLSFISCDYVKNRCVIKSPLDKEDNSAISDFLYNLGKFDAKSQIDSINSFKSYIALSQKSYQEKYQSKSKICICFGVCSGMVLSLILV